MKDSDATYYCSDRGVPSGAHPTWTTFADYTGAEGFINLLSGNTAYAHVSLCPWGLGLYGGVYHYIKHNRGEAGSRVSIAFRLKQ